MITKEQIERMDLTKVQSVLISLWMERRPNMELIEVCEKRIERLNIGHAIVEQTDFKDFEV